jgi:hypothetical protein
MTKPEVIFRAGAVRASVFRNSIVKSEKSFSFPKIVLTVRYKDNFGNWKTTNSMNAHDLPKAIFVLQKAYEYLIEHKSDPAHQGDPPGSNSY